MKRLKALDVFDISFSGGEIFSRKDIFVILETAAMLKFPKMRMTTNGTLVNAETAKQLAAIKLSNIEISLDGDKEINDRIRGGGSFSRSIEGLSHLIENGIIPLIRFTPLKNNYKRLKNLVDLLYPLGVRRLVFNRLHATGKCSKIYNEIMLNPLADFVDFRKIVDEIRSTNNGFEISDPDESYRSFPGNYEKIRLSADSMDKQSLKPCSAAHSSCSITSSGWVIPCSELFDFRGGNTREQDFGNIWRNSENFEKIRNLSDISTGEIPYCRNCEYNLFCSAGCRADAYAVYGDLMAPDPFCPFWKEK